MNRNEYHRNKKIGIAIDTASILRDVRKQWWGILMGAMVFVLLFLSYCYTLYTPTYQSTTLLATYSNNSDVLTNSSNASSVLSTLTTMLNEEVLLRIVVQETEIPSSTFSISASGISNTNLLTVTVEAESPSESLLILKSTLANFQELLGDVMSDVRLVSVQETTLVENEVNENLLYIYCALAFLLGAVACSSLVISISIFRNTVKNYDELKQKIGGRKLGYIPYIPERKMKDKGILHSWQKEKYQMLGNQILRSLAKNDDQVLLVTSALPNEGKTTVSIQVARNISKQGKKVLLIDGDFRNPSIGRELEFGEKYNQCLQDALIKKNYSLDNLYKMQDLELYCLSGIKEKNGLGHTFSDGSFEALLAHMREEFDYIIIDSPPMGVVAYSEIMKRMCDKVLLVVGQDMAPTNMVYQIAEEIRELEKLLGSVLRHTRKGKKNHSYGYYGYDGYQVNQKEQV